ncbi:MAG: hypothetical protein DRG76_03310 [Deltaproteobacteria bacterium]|nr:MAG: hypothetical protein DRG76_03310 [Deltaproteobacteria bacterium]
MGKRGRFGKYGEVKRLARLREAKLGPRTFYNAPDIHKRNNSGLPRHKTLVESVALRKAGEEDRQFIRYLSKKVFREYGPYDITIPRWFDSGAVVTIVAFMESLPVGFAILGPLVSKMPISGESELLAIAVEPTRQRRGIGSLLMERILDEAKSLGIRRISLHTAQRNIPAQRLFKKYGFVIKEKKTNFYVGGQDAVLMRKELSDTFPEDVFD